MKKTVLLSISLIISMQIMTACTSQENTEGSLTDTAINSNNETTDATSKSDEILDDIILTNAMNSSDSSKCSEILDKEKLIALTKEH